MSEIESQLSNPRIQLEIAKRALVELGDPSDIAWMQWKSLRCKTDEEYRLFEGRVKLDRFQIEMAAAAFSNMYRIIAVKGCTKAGKGLIAALIVNLIYDLKGPDCKIILSGPKYEVVKTSLFAEVSNWRKRMQFPWKSAIGQENVRDPEDEKHSILINVPNAAESLSGQHTAFTVYVIDEATKTPQWYLANAMQQASLLIALANPRTLSGWFRGLFDPADPDVTKDRMTEYGMARCITVSSEDLINVRHRRLMIPVAPKGGIDIDGCEYQQGEKIAPRHVAKTRLLIPAQKDYSDFCLQRDHRDDMIRLVFCFGRFPKEDVELQVIPTGWLPRHTMYWNALDHGRQIEVEALGIDIATSPTGDDTAVAMGGWQGCRDIESRPGAPAEDTAPWICAVADRAGVDILSGKVPIAVDTCGGYGDAVAMLLREWGAWVISVNSGAGAYFDRDRYADARAELWGEMAKRLDPNGAWPDPELMLLKQREDGIESEIDWQEVEDKPWAIPDTMPDLIDGIRAQQRRAHTKQKLHLIPKRNPPARMGYTGDTVINRMKNGKSPDKADALVLLWRALLEIEHQKSRPPKYLTVDRPLLTVTEEDLVKAGGGNPVAEVLAQLDRMDNLRDPWNNLAQRSFRL